jgi:hypothetical protein
MYSTRYSCHILRKLEFSVQILERYPSTRSREKQSSGSRVVPRGLMDRCTDMKLIVTFRIFANVPSGELFGTKESIMF